MHLENIILKRIILNHSLVIFPKCTFYLWQRRYVNICYVVTLLVVLFHTRDGLYLSTIWPCRNEVIYLFNSGLWSTCSPRTCLYRFRSWGCIRVAFPSCSQVEWESKTLRAKIFHKWISVMPTIQWYRSAQ